MLELNLPIAPLSVNHAWQGRRFKTKQYAQFERDVCKILPPAKETIQGWINVTYEYGLPPKVFSITDTGNLEKCLTDIIVKRGYIFDDRKIIKLTAEKVRSPQFYVKVCIIPLA